MVAATSMKEAGYSTLLLRREITTRRSSIGARSASIIFFGASQNSSAKSTPLCARDISPGRIVSEPPPTSAGRDAV